MSVSSSSRPSSRRFSLLACHIRAVGGADKAMGMHVSAGRHGFPAGGSGLESFEQFFREHYQPVVRLAQSVLGDLHQAQDVAQEVFLAAYQRFTGDTDRAPGWLRVAAVHRSLNVLRGERRRDRRNQLAGPARNAPSAEDTAIEHENLTELQQALARLPQRAATILILRHSGVSYVEIADALDIKVGQVGTTLRRAESSLGKEMHRATRA